MVRIFFSTTGAGTTDIPYKRMKVDVFFHIIKIASQWITGLNIKANIIHFLKEDRKFISDFLLVNNCLDMTPKAQLMKENKR